MDLGGKKREKKKLQEHHASASFGRMINQVVYGEGTWYLQEEAGVFYGRKEKGYSSRW